MVIGLYLAAGFSRRFGGGKLDMPVGSCRLGSIALKTALKSKLDAIIVVSREKCKFIKPFVISYKSRLIHTVTLSQCVSQSQSIQHGLGVAQAHFKTHAIIILLADQPLITVDIINTLLKHQGSKKHFISATYKGIPRPPVLIKENMFKYIYDLKGDMGARHIIREQKDEGQFIPFYDERPFMDIDSKTDYINFLGKYYF